MARRAHFVLVLILAQFVTSAVVNDTLKNEINLKGLKTRRRARSTSSESDSFRAAQEDADVSGGESLNIVFTDSDSSEDSAGTPKFKKPKKDRAPKSTVERRGWRKWHRKCNKCPEDMLMKWRDPSIKWICGAYQQARRSFKSLCMMHYRNCQDGTMFTKIADHRCPNGTKGGVRPYNHHFFYDYKVELTDQESASSSASESGDTSASTSVSDSEIEKNLPPFVFDRDR